MVSDYPFNSAYPIFNLVNTEKHPCVFWHEGRYHTLHSLSKPLLQLRYLNHPTNDSFPTFY